MEEEIYIDNSTADVTEQTETAVLDVLYTPLDSLTITDVCALLGACILLICVIRLLFIQRR